MAMKADTIWMNGKFVPWENATMHVLSHVVHYGTCAFEGIRCYNNTKGSAIFRLRDHIVRLFDTCKIYNIVPDYTIDDLVNACVETVRKNKLSNAYIRPFIYRGFGSLGVSPLDCPIETAVAAWDWGTYLGSEALEKGIRAGVSSWNRPAPNTFPTMAKMAGTYINSQLIKVEAMQRGYNEGIALDRYGFVSEGSGENIFIVRSGVLYTPPSTSSILPGITRHCIFKIAREKNIRCEHHQIQREALYLSDEVFLVGTAAEITPVISIDDRIVGDGKRGPITKIIQDYFFDIIKARVDDPFGWLTYI